MPAHTSTTGTPGGYLLNWWHGAGAGAGAGGHTLGARQVLAWWPGAHGLPGPGAVAARRVLGLDARARQVLACWP